ncbi:MAG: DMT family transporter [Anaerolineae bacterium]
MLAAGVLCIGFSAIFVRLAGVPGAVSGFYRLAISSVVLIIPMFLHWRRGRVHLPRRAAIWALLAGLALAGDMALWNTALIITDVSIATLLDNLAPIWVGLVMWLFLRQRPAGLYWLGLAVAIAGVVIILGVDVVLGLGADRGSLLALAAGGTYAAYQLFAKRARAEIDTLSYFWVFTTTGALILYLLARLLGNPLTGYPVSSYLALAGLALFTHTLGWLLISYAYGYLSATSVAVAALGQPVITTLAAMPILGEIPDAEHIIGGVIALAGILIAQRGILTAPTPDP